MLIAAGVCLLLMTVRENADFWAGYLGADDRAHSDTPAALERFGLAELADIPAAILSAGQKRRLGLARLLLAYRPLWLLDEPTVSLDATNRVRFTELINEHLAAGGLVVAATHLPLGLSNARELPASGPL